MTNEASNSGSTLIKPLSLWLSHFFVCPDLIQKLQVIVPQYWQQDNGTRPVVDKSAEQLHFVGKVHRCFIIWRATDLLPANFSL